MPRIQANFHLYAENLDRAIKFYEQHFGFTLLGRIDETDDATWAAIKIENAIIWLGAEGTSTGLILLVDKEFDTFVRNLREKEVEFFVPDSLKEKIEDDSYILSTSWGEHAWFFDSERNVVMLFMPAEG